MLNLLGVMVSTIVMLLAVFRSIYLDGTVPWFWQPGQKGASPKSRTQPALRPWQKPRK